MLSKFLQIDSLLRKINTGKEMMAMFPQNRAEYLDETLHYSRILYDLLKESVLP